MKDGVININKPAGWTSQDVCSKLRHRLRIKRIGHTGTLDPMATGVLPVCIGKATRIIEYYDRDLKTYRARMKLGTISDTLDIWGTILEEHPVRISDEGGEYTVSESSIRRAFADYTGAVSQVPPKYSALKINGRRAYDLARQGADFELKKREIMIMANEITDIDRESGVIGFEVTCSKGTYIRTICDDIGRTLGCGAVMTELKRTASGMFDIYNAAVFENLLEMTDEEIGKCIIPMEDTLIFLGTVQLDDNRFTAFINGNSSGSGYSVTEESHFADSEGLPVYRVFASNVFLGTAVIKDRQLIPAKVIYSR